MLPLRMFVALSPRFADRLSRREDDRFWVTDRLSKLEQRVASLEAMVAGQESELAAVHTALARAARAPMPAPSALESLGLPGLSRARRRK